MTNQKKVWWKEAVAYQVYPRSFLDTNADGVGDLRGIIEKLDYLAELGITLLWISPVYRSPMCDNGYDIADYYEIDPLFGTNADMEELLKKANALGIHVIMDLVANHCSSEHTWFQKALADPDCEEVGYFIFKTTADGKEPNNWRSNFGGSVWTQLEDGRYYMHTFDKGQPDLNWESPLLRQKLYAMMNWWVEKGIAGFRVDAITFIKKDNTFASYPAEIGGRYPIEKFQNFPGIGDFLSEMREEVFDRNGCVTVAEAPGVSYEELGSYMGDNGHFSMIFDFNWDHFEYPDNCGKNDDATFQLWREKIFYSQEQMAKTGWSPLFLENHDQPRCPNKFLSEENRNRQSITMLATIYFLLRGTPFIYQGQELGVTNYHMASFDDVYDTAAHGRRRETIQNGQCTEKLLAELNETGRDHARTPFPWNAGEHAGFSSVIPWIPVHPDYRSVNADDEQRDAQSVLAYYKALSALRSDPEYRETLVYGSCVPCCTDTARILGYVRENDGQRIVVLNHFSDKVAEVTLPYPCERVLLNNMPEGTPSFAEKETVLLQPYQSVVYLAKE